MNEIKRPQRLLEKSNIPDSVPDLSFGFSRNNVYKCVKYYYENFTNVDVLDYNVSDQNIETNGTRIIDSVNNIVDTRSGYSSYNEEIMETIGYNTDEYWNGDNIMIYFEGNDMMFMKSDYYSNKMMKGLLYCESAKALDDVNCDLTQLDKSRFPLRNSLLSSEDDFLMSNYVKGGSSGAIIFGKYNDEWHLVLGKRSQEVGVNKGYYSIIPNGSIEYEEFKDDPRFIETTKREFNEEISPSDNFFDKHVDYEQVFTGFNIVSGSFTSGHALFIDNEDKFKSVCENGDSNFEFSDIEVISVNNLSKIQEIVQYSNFSPSVIPIIINGLIRFNKKDNLPDLDYEIERV